VNQQPQSRRPASPRTYTPMTISLDERTRLRLRTIADAAGASKTAIIVLALQELFGGRRDATIAQMVRRGGARKRRK
jgi:predicted transcriptional regulator